MSNSFHQVFRSAGRPVIFGLATALMLATVSPALAGGRGHHRHHSHRIFHVSPYFYGHAPYYSYGHYRHYGHYGYYPGYGYHGGYGYGPGKNPGALKLKVKPKDTQVFVNGGLVGQTGSFDGFPGYLWLPEDSYEVILYRDGYETVVRNYRLLPGVVIKEKFEMTPGDAVDPKELTAFPEPKAEKKKKAKPARKYYRPKKAPTHEQAGVTPGKVVFDARQAPGQARLQVEPADATVYLDGELLGQASNLPTDQALDLAAGEHVLEVVRPGLLSEEKRFTVRSGEEVDVTVRLTQRVRGDV